MTIYLDKDALIAMDPCDLDERLAKFGRRKRMNVKQAIDAGFSTSDILWVAGQLGLKNKCVEFAIECAKRVAHLNTDPRVQAAIDATQAYLNSPSDAAASAAASAARVIYAKYAKYTKYTAADAAAYAAANAAKAAADAAAYAAANAYTAAYAAANAAKAAKAAAGYTAGYTAVEKELLIKLFG